jgi:hypothetical protein
MPVRFRALLAALGAGAVLYACGGSNGGGSGGSDNPPPSGNPCATTSVEAEEAPLAAVVPAPPVVSKAEAVDGSPRWRVLDALWTHRQGAGTRLEAQAPDRNAADVGDIAVLQDEGDIILPPNQFDLRSAGVRFTRNGSGGYDARRIDGTFRQTLGRRLTLTDDDSVQVTVPFSFTFYNRAQSLAFVNSDGNVTFEEEDKASTERNVARLLTGPPRVSPFLADLDPTTGQGRVFVNAVSDQYTVTWCNVRGFDSTRTISTQTTLLPDGTIEMKYTEGATSLGDAVVGLSPGRGGAVGERFAESGQLDTVAISRKFYRTHPDNFDQLVIWTDVAIIRDAFAYETTVANEIRGIGVDIFDAARDFGSGGALRSLCIMDWIGKYPDDPTRVFLGENTTLSVLGQEVGHRWLAFLRFRDRTGARSDALLGRGLAHWSFFFDSDASVMEGNDIEDLGGGSFRTVAAVQRYSRLDQYAMGLLDASQVPTFFYVETPINVVPNRTNEDAPRVGVTFNGTRRDVLIQDVIAVEGSRQPGVADSPKVHRQAFIYVVSAGRTADAAQVDKVDRIRRQWEPFFLLATDGRMRAQTALH